MTHYSIDIKNFGIKAYESEATAKVMANGCLIFSNIDEMLDNPNVTLTTFANMFNANSPAKVKRFADKKSAAKRLFNLVEELDLSVRGDAPVEETADVKKARAVAKARQVLKAKENAKKRNPRHELVGKFIRAKVLFKSHFFPSMMGLTQEQLDAKGLHNPRKPYTNGHVSHQILINNQQENIDQWMSFELYTSLGGRLEDARWDIKKGWVEVKD
jgi:hypothetical protein